MSDAQILQQINNRLARVESLLDNDSGTGRMGMYQEQIALKKYVQSVDVKLTEEIKAVTARVDTIEEAQRFDKWRFTAIGGAIGGIVAVIAKALWGVIAKVMF